MEGCLPRGAQSLILCLVLIHLSACTRGEARANAEGGASPTGSVGAQTSALGTSAVSSSGSLAPVSQNLQRACKDICDRSRRLKCTHVDECLPNCIAMASATPCSEEVAVFYECLNRQPLQNWECAEDGVAAIRDGFCNKEQGRAVGCMEAKMRP